MRDALSCWEPSTVSLTGSRHLHSTAKAAIVTIFVRTPSQFLEEVLLVDDFSDKEDLGEVRKIGKSPWCHSKTRTRCFFQGLKNYIRIFRGLVRLVRNTKREGLIRFLTDQKNFNGQFKNFDIWVSNKQFQVQANVANDKVPNEGRKGSEGSGGSVPGRALWGQQELAPPTTCADIQVNSKKIESSNSDYTLSLNRNYTTMTVPIIDGIDHETFAYRSVYQDHQHFRGIFEWGMLYKVRLKSASHKKISDCLHTHPTCMTCLPPGNRAAWEGSFKTWARKRAVSEPHPRWRAFCHQQRILPFPRRLRSWSASSIFWRTLKMPTTSN